MLVFKAESFSECYRESISFLFANGIENSARGTKSTELLDVALEIADPRQCFYLNEERGSQKKYIAAELLWYYSGRNDVAFISKWAKFWESIQNPDGTANSAYGNLIFKNPEGRGPTQYQWAIRSLIKDKNTRQAVMHFNRPAHQYFGNKDFVCTMYANCHIRNNKFYMSVFMRSNDAIWGTPTDVAFFCSLQIQMFQHLKIVYPDLELGSYTHVANSYHVYDRHYELVKKMMETEFIPESIPGIVSNLIEVDGQPSQSLQTLMDAILSNEESYLIFQDGNDLLKWIYTHAIKS
jgi:thymidylate synthase